MRTGREEMDSGERVERMVDIYENADAVRHHHHHGIRRTLQSLQHTGSVSVKTRKPKAAEVCLCLLCVLLLTAVIVLCVCYTNERKHNHNLTEEREQILNHKNNLTEEREQILNPISNLMGEIAQIKNKTDEILRALDEQDQLADSFKWIYYNFSFYYISSESLSWRSSREYCQQRGADLLIVKSSEEQKFFQKAGVAVKSEFWIALIKTEGVWKWTDGSTMTNENWGPNSQHDCALMASSVFTDYCTNQHKFICKRAILKSLKNA